MTAAVIIMLGAIIILLYLLIKFGIMKRRVIVTIVENIPIGIFRDSNKNYEIKNKVYIKEIRKNESVLNEDSSKIKNNLEWEYNKKNEDNLFKSKDASEKINEENINNNQIVYWTPNGKTYHNSKLCLALSRSKVINEGTVAESHKAALCDLCKDSL
ncbi:MAG: hypothetical protein E7207_03625 [Clostridium butyricum]|nr:hypothetical protein [Clostridium butyricum]